ncbi:MAG: type III pantothenate kinase [Bacteroidota bacterium]
MNLIVDIGNTWVKYAVFQEGNLLMQQKMDAKQFAAQLATVFKTYPQIEKAIIAATGTVEEQTVEVLEQFCSVHRLSSHSKTPFTNLYKTPLTLGVDRIALAAAAFYHNPKGNTLVVDLGTCVTYDIVNDKGEYLGGGIAPGLYMRYQAMHQQTAGLPLLQPEFPDTLIGTNTASSMHTGTFLGLCHELDGTIDQYRARFQHLTVILTGGDSHFFVERLKNHIFADAIFLLKGLDYLLEYNLK